jgi:hypothetical protein
MSEEQSIPIANDRWYAIHGSTVTALSAYMEQIPHGVAKNIHAILDKKLQIIPMVPEQNPAGGEPVEPIPTPDNTVEFPTDLNPDETNSPV